MPVAGGPNEVGGPNRAGGPNEAGGPNSNEDPTPSATVLGAHAPSDAARDVPEDLAARVASLPVGVEVKEAIALLESTLPPGATLDKRAVVVALLARGREGATLTAVRVMGASGKGLGGFAARDYERGECILDEAPLLEWSVAPGEPVTRAALDACVDALSPANRVAFYALCQNAEHGEQKSAYGIWLSNAFPTDGTNRGAKATPAASAERRSGAVFSTYCRLNHSCAPNVHGCWNPACGRQTMYALRDIQRGDELQVSYLGRLDLPRCDRRASLQRDFGFKCSCARCSMDADALGRSDARMTRLTALRGSIATAVSSRGYQEAVGALLARRGAPTLERLIGGGGPKVGGAASAISPAVVEEMRAVRQQWLGAGLSLLEERLSLLGEEGGAGLALAWDTLETASRFCHMMGDHAASRRYGARATECARLALGTQSAEYQSLVALGESGSTSAVAAPRPPAATSTTRRPVRRPQR